MRGRLGFVLICGFFLGFGAGLVCVAQTGGTQPKYMDPSLPVDERVNDLISQMTLEEKVSQMRDHAPAIPRLGVPKYDWWNEGLHGVALPGTRRTFRR